MAEVGDQMRKGQKRKAKKMDREVKIRRLTNEQMKILESYFARERKLEPSMKFHLAAELGLVPNQVAVWFQNRRVRWKNKQLEEEYERLKSMKEIIDRERCQLENEVVELKGKLAEAEEEIKKLSQVPMGNYQMLLGEDWFTYEYECTHEGLMTSCVDFV